MDATLVAQDTIPPTTRPDSLLLDAADLSALSNPGPDSLGPLPSYKVSPSTPEAPIDYSAKDSMHFDLVNKVLYLYGNAYVKYQQTELKAGFISVDFTNNVVTAKPYPDSTGNFSGYPDFKEGSQQFTAESMKYNYKTSKGVVYQARTQQSDMFINGEKTKLVIQKTDTSSRNIIYQENAIVTTCDRPEPHFGIRTRKMKVVPGKVAIVGPSNLEISSIPTPAFLPFGFFPITQERSAGLIIPNGYEFNPRWGYGLENLGYFTPLGEYMNLTVNTRLYTRGTFGFTGTLNYKRRYKFSGNFSFSYNRLNEENPSTGDPRIDNTYRLVWRHSQDGKAHPYNRLSGNIHFEINNPSQQLGTDFNSQAQNSLNSNVSFSRNFPNNGPTVSLGLTHSQNTRTRQVTVTLPNYQATLSTFQPFERKKQVGERRWYEDISVSYRSSGLVQFRGIDTTFFTRQTLEEAEYGVRHDITTNTNLRFLKYFNLTPQVNYSEDWFFRSFEQVYDPEVRFDTTFNEDSVIVSIEADTLSEFRTIERGGFTPLRRYDLSMGLDFSLFGTAQFRKFWLRGIRHTLRSNFTFVYSPDYTGPGFGYFKTRTDGEGNEELYSIFEPEAGLRTLSLNNARRRMQLNFGFTNRIQARHFSKKDSTFKTLTLLNNFSLNGNYNFAADSFRLSEISGGGAINFFDRMSTLQINVRFDPYAIENGRRVDRYLWENGNTLLRFENLRLNLNTTLTVDGLRRFFNKSEGGASSSTSRSGGRGSRGRAGRSARAPSPEEPDNSRSARSSSDLDQIISGLRFIHRLNFDRTIDPERGLDTARFTNHSINLQVNNIQLSPNWNISIGNVGYDFLNQRVTYPDFRFIRDLHCWEMSLAVQPIRGTYQFRIAVKPGSLQFIEVPYRKSPQDAASQAVF